MLDDYLLIDKPKGWTSFDVVAKVRGIVKHQTGQKVKVGHSGTLDPMATGLLIILVGKATKQQDSFMKKDKVYEAEITLGKTSDTYDAEGSLTDVNDKVPQLNEVQKALTQSTGKITQTPPAYSAIKVNGKKAYELARAGKKVELKSREVTVYSIDDVSYEYPKVTFTCKVSSGTYIRSLANDIGELLGCGGYLSSLKRTQIDEYSVKDAISIEQLSDSNWVNQIKTIV